MPPMCDVLCIPGLEHIFFGGYCGFFSSFLFFCFFPALEASHVRNNNNNNATMRLAQQESGGNVYMRWVQGAGGGGRREEKKNTVARSFEEKKMPCTPRGRHGEGRGCRQQHLFWVRIPGHAAVCVCMCAGAWKHPGTVLWEACSGLQPPWPEARPSAAASRRGLDLQPSSSGEVCCRLGRLWKTSPRKATSAS